MILDGEAIGFAVYLIGALCIMWWTIRDVRSEANPYKKSSELETAGLVAIFWPAILFLILPAAGIVFGLGYFFNWAEGVHIGGRNKS